ncbi:MAG: hypothetical protein AAF704_07915 [Cyanobacteria bacterium P01_D01_bin.123]
MFPKISTLSASLLLCLAVPNVALAATWEELYSSKSTEAEARVELKEYSFRKRLTVGEKIISAQLRTFYREGETTTQATGDYEIHCAARKVFRSNLNMEVEDASRNVGTIRQPNKVTLEGQEYQDFIGLMDILCSR